MGLGTDEGLCWVAQCVFVWLRLGKERDVVDGLWGWAGKAEVESSIGLTILGPLRGMS